MSGVLGERVRAQDSLIDGGQMERVVAREALQHRFKSGDRIGRFEAEWVKGVGVLELLDPAQPAGPPTVRRKPGDAPEATENNRSRARRAKARPCVVGGELALQPSDQVETATRAGGRIGRLYRFRVAPLLAQHGG